MKSEKRKMKNEGTRLPGQNQPGPGLYARAFAVML
jgi:hypothetical protein